MRGRSRRGSVVQPARRPDAAPAAHGPLEPARGAGRGAVARAPGRRRRARLPEPRHVVGDPRLRRVRGVVRQLRRRPLARVRARNRLPQPRGERHRVLPRLVHDAARAHPLALVALPPPLRHPHRRAGPRDPLHAAVPPAHGRPEPAVAGQRPEADLAHGPARGGPDRRRDPRLRAARRDPPRRPGGQGVRRRSISPSSCGASPRGASSRPCSSCSRRSTASGCCGSSPPPSTPASGRTCSTTGSTPARCT